MTDQQLRELVEKAVPPGDDGKFWSPIDAWTWQRFTEAWLSRDRALAALNVIDAVRRYEAGAVADDQDREQAMYDAVRAWDALNAEVSA